ERLPERQHGGARRLAAARGGRGEIGEDDAPKLVPDAGEPSLHLRMLDEAILRLVEAEPPLGRRGKACRHILDRAAEALARLAVRQAQFRHYLFDAFEDRK